VGVAALLVSAHDAEIMRFPGLPPNANCGEPFLISTERNPIRGVVNLPFSGVWGWFGVPDGCAGVRRVLVSGCWPSGALPMAADRAEGSIDE